MVGGTEARARSRPTAPYPLRLLAEGGRPGQPRVLLHRPPTDRRQDRSPPLADVEADADRPAPRAGDRGPDWRALGRQAVLVARLPGDDLRVHDDLDPGVLPRTGGDLRLRRQTPLVTDCGDGDGRATAVTARLAQAPDPPGGRARSRAGRATDPLHPV